MSAVRIEQGDVELFRHPDPRQVISGLRRHLLPKLKRLRAAGLSVAERRLDIDPKALASVERPANRPDADEVVVHNEAYVGVSWPRSRNPLAVKTADGKPRFYPPTYLYFGLYPDGHLRVQLLWYRYNVEAPFRRDLRALVESQGVALLEILRQRGIRDSDAADEPLGATLDRSSCLWAGKPLDVPIAEGDAAWNEAVEDFVLLLPLARAAWRLAVGEVPNLAVDCQAVRKGWSPDSRSERDVLGAALPDEVDPDEVDPDEVYLEGSVHRELVNAYERDPAARKVCIEHYGATCVACGFDFGAVYGPLAEGVIHVHHVKPLAEIGEKYAVDPIADLRPVCANCHAIIHLGGGCRGIEEARSLVHPRVLAFWKELKRTGPIIEGRRTNG